MIDLVGPLVTMVTLVFVGGFSAASYLRKISNSKRILTGGLIGLLAGIMDSYVISIGTSDSSVLYPATMFFVGIFSAFGLAGGLASIIFVKTN